MKNAETNRCRGVLFFFILHSSFFICVAGAQIFKANNNSTLDQGASWVGGAAPGSGGVATWDATVATAANCTNTLGVSVNLGGILISNPAASVKILTNNSPTISLGASGISLSKAAVGLWIAPALTTVADQTWNVTNGVTLTLGESNRTVTIANGVTLAGNILFPNAISISSSGTLNISSGTTLTSTITNNSVTSITVNGVVNHTGGTVTVGRSDSTSGSPKSTLTIGSGSAGIYNISGGFLIDGSTTSDGRIDVGTGGSAPGTLNVSGNATLQLQSLYIANGGNGTVNVTNGIVTIANNFRVGVSAGTGTMNVFGGTVQSASTLNLPNGPGTGVLNVNGGAVNVSAISVATSSGGGGPGTLTVNGGVLNVANGLALAPAIGNGTLNLNGGTAIVSSVTHAGSGIATLNWNGGTLKPNAATAAFIASNVAATVLAGGAMVDATNFNITIPCALLNGTGGTADGGLTKLGSGTLTLASTNSYNGPTVVSAGTLVATNAGSIASSTNLVAAAGATLNVSGVGTLALRSAPVLNGTLVMQINKNGATLTSDRLTFTNGAINFGGALTVIVTGNPLTNADVFDLFVATNFTGTFLTLNLPALNPGLGWDTSRLNVDGTIKVSGTSGPAILPSFGSVSTFNRTNLILTGSGGTTNGAYFVLSSTNLALPLTNWTMIGGSNGFDANGNFNFTNAIYPSRPAQFYALSLSPQILSPTDADALQALQNMRDEGWNSWLPSPGGLYINWIYTNSPPVSSNNVNLNYNGTPDASPTLRHDRLTDIVYLADLVLYKQLHPLDPQFDAEMTKYTAICQNPAGDGFMGHPDQRGWVYWVLQEIISGIPSFTGADNTQADKYYNVFTNNLLKNYNGQVTPLYIDWNTNDTAGMHGTYTVSLVVEDACVLIVNGRARNLPNHITAGEMLMAFAQSNAYSSTLNIWADTMGNLFTTTNQTGGTVSPPGQQVIYDNNVNASEIGEMTEALCRAEAADPGKGYGALALATLNKLTPATNSFGLWDSTYGGYFANLNLNGTDIQSPGLTASVNTGYKEVGRAAIVIRSFIFANQFAGAHYGSNALAALNTANLNSYYSAGHGWLYQMNPDYSLYLDHGTGYSVYQNWVTSEATSHAIRALLTARIQGVIQ